MRESEGRGGVGWGAGGRQSSVNRRLTFAMRSCSLTVVDCSRKAARRPPRFDPRGQICKAGSPAEDSVLRAGAGAGVTDWRRKCMQAFVRYVSRRQLPDVA